MILNPSPILCIPFEQGVSELDTTVLVSALSTLCTNANCSFQFFFIFSTLYIQKSLLDPLHFACKRDICTSTNKAVNGLEDSQNFLLSNLSVNSSFRNGENI